MGHNTLGVIPATRTWRAVVDLLGSASATESVIAASAKAAEKDMLHASHDPVFVEAVRLLLSIPHAARSDDFAAALRSAGLVVPDRPELFDIVAATTKSLDEAASRSASRTDLGELAARALTSTVTDMIGGSAQSLFGTSAAEIQAVARKYSWSKGIAELSRKFFGSLVGTSLSYWLDRTLADHVGPGKRFANVADRHSFDVALDSYSVESSRIIKEFSGGWYGKTLHTHGRIGTAQAAQFGAVCLKKITQELQRKRDHVD